MAVFKCKMCGGELAVTEGMTVAECDYCGTKQTLPKPENDRQANLYDRANHFRRNNEFDKAMGIYEQILNENAKDAEAYWSIILCRYGIEYVEDPATRKRVPTVNRSQYTSVFDDDNYKSALLYADDQQKLLYQAEATEINRLQKEILAISRQEEPFDVFICYKETDKNGRRTPDSVLAQELYFQLTKEGFRVFFSRITLEDKLGSAYEPYIFAALHSARVMVVLGTRPEHFNAVWVKNEWSRYLTLIKSDRQKVLIPAYKDMDPYDLPEEFSHLQAQDMSKLGFMQDLIRGIGKLARPAHEEPQTTVVKETVVAPAANTAPLLKRAFMFLEDGEWDRADEFCEQVLNQDPECAEAYLGKLMAELHSKTRKQLQQCEKPFDKRNNYQKAIRFGDEALKNELEGYIAFINTRNENARLEGIYVRAMEMEKNAERAYQNATSSSGVHCFEEDMYNLAAAHKAYSAVAATFESIGGYKDAVQLAASCQGKIQEIEETRKNLVYANATKKMNSGYPASVQSALEDFQQLAGWRDAAAKAELCRAKLQEIAAREEAERLEAQRQAEIRRQEAEQAIRRAREQAEARKKKIKKIAAIVTPIVCVLVTFVIVLVTVIIPNGEYNDAVELMEAGKYEEAIAAFEAMDGYKDSKAKIDECRERILNRDYDAAIKLMEAGKYEEAAEAFEVLDGYKDSEARFLACQYSIAVALKKDGKYPEAIKAFEAANGYRDSAEQIVDCRKKYLAPLLQHNSVSTGGYHTVGLCSDGTVVAVGKSGFGQCEVSDWTDIVSISAGYDYTVGLRADGTVVAVGENGNGQCDVSGWTDIVAISTGNYHTVGLRADGTVVAVGKSGFGQCEVSDWTDIVSISAGYDYTVGLRADGTVVATGRNSDGQCAVSDWTNIVAISAGAYHTIGLRADGTVVAVGENYCGQCAVSGWTDIVAISAGLSHSVGLRADGTVVVVGANDHYQCDVFEWTDIVAISAGTFQTVGLRTDGTVVATGRNDYGQCDVSDWKNIYVPED